MSDIRLAGSRVSTWGEGPIWWNYSLYYVDIEKNMKKTTMQETVS